MRKLSSLDAQFLGLETATTYAHVCHLAIFDPSTVPGGTFNAERVKALLAERIHLIPPFHQRLVQVPFGIDNPSWVEDDRFDLDFHVRELAVPPPGDDSQLADLVSRIVARHLDRTRPLWELYVIHGLREGRVALLGKVHHAAVDGVSGGEIMTILFDLGPEGREVDPPKGRVKHRRIPSQWEVFARSAAVLPAYPLKVARVLPTTLPHLDQIPAVGQIPGSGLLAMAAETAHRMATRNRDGRVIERYRGPVPRTSFNGRLSQHRRFAFGQLPLDTVKQIRNAYGVSVNDVVVAVVAGALRRRLEKRGDEVPGDPLVAMIPVSVRTKEQRGQFGNQISNMIVPIPTHLAEPKERMEYASTALLSAKKRHRAMPASLLSDASQFVPPAIFARAARVVTGQAAAGRLGLPFNVVISNVPGPRFDIYCAGARMEAHYPVSVLTDGVTLNVTLLSYKDHLDFGIIGDRELVPDVADLMDDLRLELEELAATL